MSETATKVQAFKLKGRLYTFTVLQILSTDAREIAMQLQEAVAQAPKMFARAPVVLDLAQISTEFDFQGLCQLLREHGLIPVAVQGASAWVETMAQCEGLAVLNASASRDKPVIERADAAPAPSQPTKTKIVSTPVRSGQQIVAKGGDLVITAAVSHGAELLADGNIHVYGALRGRALAGMSGDTEARIFCHSLDAELLAIAGFYTLSDTIQTMTGPCQIYLKDEQVQIQAL